MKPRRKGVGGSQRKGWEARGEGCKQMNGKELERKNKTMEVKKRGKKRSKLKEGTRGRKGKRRKMKSGGEGGERGEQDVTRDGRPRPRTRVRARRLRPMSTTRGHQAFSHGVSASMSLSPNTPNAAIYASGEGGTTVFVIICC